MEKEKEIFIDYLKNLMEELPELRIGQILYSYILSSTEEDIFFVSDTEIIKEMQKNYENIMNKRQERKIKKLLSNPKAKAEIIEILKKYE